MNPLMKQQKSTQRQNNGGNVVQQFMAFANEMKGKDLNQELNNLIASGRVTQEQVNNATNFAKSLFGLTNKK